VSSVLTARLRVRQCRQDQAVEIFEIRPRWDDPQVILEIPAAKATYVKTQGVWKVFWQRADLKWPGYEPNLTVAPLKEFLAVVEADEYACDAHQGTFRPEYLGDVLTVEFTLMGIPCFGLNAGPAFRHRLSPSAYLYWRLQCRANTFRLA